MAFSLKDEYRTARLTLYQFRRISRAFCDSRACHEQLQDAWESPGFLWPLAQKKDSLYSTLRKRKSDVLLCAPFFNGCL
jgi:hypothetical protein